jgi:hypothetical protein
MMDSDPLRILESFEKALFSGDDIGRFFADDAVYEVTGSPMHPTTSLWCAPAVWRRSRTDGSRA